MTMVLLENWGEENIQERLKECTRKKPIWVEISNFLKASGYEDREFAACKTRIQTLVSAYRAYKDQSGKTGTATSKIPPFFEELDGVLSDKPATKPLLLLNSGKFQQEQGEDVENDEHGDTNSETEDEEKAEYPELKKVAKRVNGK